MQESLMLAVLSMDAYFNRAQGWQVGTAIISKPPADPVDGFAAYAYAWNGTEIIAFRGTNDLSDVLHGWLAGGDYRSSPQPCKVGVAVKELMPGQQNNPAHHHLREEAQFVSGRGIA